MRSLSWSGAIAALVLTAAPVGALVHSSADGATSTSAATAAAIASVDDADTGAVSAAPVTTAAATDVVAADDGAAIATGSSTTAAEAGTVNDKDAAGSTEVATVQRSCGAPHDPHFEPPSGQGLSACKDANGNHDNSKTYTAKHFTNEVKCGTDEVLVPNTDVVTVSGDGGGGPSGGGGFLQVCSQNGLPIHGRITAQGAASTGGANGSITADGDNSNQPEQLTGWAQVNLSGTNVSHRCGKAYDEGGRGDASNPTGEDTAAECG